MKFKTLVLVAVAAASLFAGGLKKEEAQSFYVTGDSGVQKTKKWPVADLWYKSLALRMDDTSTTSSDSCGINVLFYGFIRNHSDTGHVSDSARLGFSAASLLYKTAWDTVKNGENQTTTQLIDTSIVVADSLTSTRVDGVMDFIQMSFIAACDSVQAWIYPNTWTRKGSAVAVQVRLNQVNPKSWR